MSSNRLTGWRGGFVVKDFEAEAKIQTLDWAGLRDLWGKIQAGDTPDWDPGKAFEYLILQIFHLDGAVVRWPYQAALHGEVVEQIDGVVVAAGLHALIESKDLKGPVTIEPIAKLRNQLMRRPVATIGMVFSTSGYTNPALTLARYLSGQTILLWQPVEVDFALEKEKIVPLLQTKYLACVMDGTPDANTISSGVP
jgi:Restriction endonuclease